jgi:hypothetical protein
MWPTEWLRAGVVTQRTRVYKTERDIQRGLLLGFSFKRLEGTVLLLQPRQRRPLHGGVARSVVLKERL